MNGRTYDTRLGRFMQADIAVQAPFDTQSYNRYSYLMNNPLNGTDPSGYFLEGLLGDPVIATYVLGKYLPPAVSQAGVAIGSMFCGPWAPACAAGGTAVTSYAQGGTVEESLKAGALAGVASYAFSYMNTQVPFSCNPVGNVFANGIVGGAISVAQGGNFGHGFLSAGFSAAAGGGLRAANIGSPGVRVFAAAVVGGTASAISGGKFANGAATAAFQAATAEFSNADSELRDEGESGVYAETDVDWDGDVVVTKTKLYDSLPLEEMKEAVDRHEDVHAHDLKPFVRGKAFWGWFARRRAISELGYHHMEVKAYKAELEFIGSALRTMPQGTSRDLLIQFEDQQMRNMLEHQRGINDYGLD